MLMPKALRKTPALFAILMLCASLAWMSMALVTAQAQECPRIYKPVCGVVVSASRIATYPNSCEADKAGARILHEGKCQGPGQERCPHIQIPVCAKNSSGEKTYDNLCWAEKDWAVLIHKGPC